VTGAAQKNSEWDWVKSAPAENRPLLWKIRRRLIQARCAPGQQVACAENRAATRMGLSKRLADLTYDELWLLIDQLD